MFFTSLISELDGYKLNDVMDIKVESKLHDPAPNLTETDEDEETSEPKENIDEAVARVRMLSVVENIILKGSLLLNSAEYQQLRQKGFYITSIVWTAKQTEAPYDVIELDAGFDHPREGTGFRYNVRGVYRYFNGTPTKTLRQIPKEDRPPYFSLIERTARDVVKKLTSPPLEPAEKVA